MSWPPETRLWFYVLLIFTGLVGAVSDAIMNLWAKNHKMPWLMLGYAAWIATATLFGFLLRKEYLSAAVVLFLLSNIIFAILIGRMVFGERIAPIQWLGILVAVVAMLLLERGHMAPQ